MKNRLLVLLWMTLGVVALAVAANKKFTLVIDAGHGGHDAGALGAITKEKTINLNVSLAFGRYVERNCPDVRVIYTRKTDVFVPLHTRADIANRNKADLFISIHTNSLPRGHVARGMETYTLGMHRASDNLDVAKRENSVILIEKDYKQRYQGFDPNSSESYIMFEFIQDHNMAQSVELAKFVQRRTCALANRPNKGVKQAGFLVLRETSMPSCLIELGFISTSDEERFLHSENGVDQMARGIYQAFLDYKSKYDKNVSVPYRAESVQEVKVPTVVPKKAPEADADSTATRTAVQPVASQSEAEQPASVQPVPDQAVAARPQQPSAPVAEPVLKPAETAQPVFKVQILTSSFKLGKNASQLKGHGEADYYEEGGCYKYTVGASNDYNEIYRLRKTLIGSFPQAFIIAFKEGQKMNVQQAIQEFKANRNKR